MFFTWTSKEGINTTGMTREQCQAGMKFLTTRGDADYAERQMTHYQKLYYEARKVYNETMDKELDAMIELERLLGRSLTEEERKGSKRIELS